MSIRIILYAPEPTAFAAGQLIRGHIEVTLKSASQREAIKTVNLSFTGESKITIKVTSGSGNNRSTRYFRSNAILFVRSRQLTSCSFQPPVTRRGEDGGILSWPFEMLIPECADSIRPETVAALDGDIFSKGDIFPATMGYEGMPHYQPLPDSLPRFFARVGINTDIYGGVTYTLNAEAVGLSAGLKHLWIGNKDTECEIPIRNTNSHFGDLQMMHHKLVHDSTVRSLRLLPSHAGGSLTFREKTRSLFNKSSLPAIDLRIAFSAPNVLFLHRPRDQPLPFHITVCRMERSRSPQPRFGDEKAACEDIPTPKVYLKKLVVKLLALTAVRTTGNRSMFDRPRYQNGDKDADICVCRPKRVEESICELPVGQERFDIGERLGVTWEHLQQVAEVPDFGLVSDFSTPNLARRYMLLWEIKLEVAGEDVKWYTTEGLPVRIVSGSGESGPAMSIIPRENSANHLASFSVTEAGPSVPRYEESQDETPPLPPYTADKDKREDMASKIE